ncbi:MAG: efflux RND transporter periplasmic adaptor subunit [Clostridia bacterium]|nr:efflux RND transporter periplasmic adaptor subunit [Clostridia bacterium]
MKKKLLILFAIIISLTACGETEVSTTEVAAIPVEIQMVKSDDISTINRINGSVVTQDEVSVYAPIAGEVTEVKVKVGDKVSKNQILFSVDNKSMSRSYQALLDDYNRTKELLEKQVSLAEQSLEDTKVIYNEQVRLAKQTADNTKALYDVGAATKIDVENTEFALNQTEISANAAIRQAEIGVTSAKNSADSTLTQLTNNIKDLEDTLNKTYAKSTINGVVTAVNVTKGNMASPQMAGVVVSGSKKHQVKISVSEKIIPYISVGDIAEVSINALGGDTMNCKVDSFSPSANAMTHLYDVYLNLPDNINTVIGMFAEVTLKTNTHVNTIVIPTQAILNDGEIQYVYIATDNNTKATKVVVRTGIIGDGVTEVIEGLKEGDNLVIKGQSYLTDGGNLRVVGV